MSAFTETALLKKLSELNSSQQSIQTLSLWLIHHRKHHASIVKTWFRELQNVSENKKLTFMYLANDVIQNSKKKGPEYGREFLIILPKVFTHIGESCFSEKLFGSLGRILCIWEERSVYEHAVINEYRSLLNKKHGSSGNSNFHKRDESRENVKKIEKRKHEDSRNKTRHMKLPHTHSEDNATKDSSEDVLQISPYIPHGEPPEPEELIKALLATENSASSDATVREKIANLPQEISDVNYLHKLEDKEKAKKLSNEVNDALTMLNDYNARLAAEMESRGKLAIMLRNFYVEQKELLTQAETRYEEYSKKYDKMIGVQKEIQEHISNLPDIAQLKDVTKLLAPLPSAGDLFNTH
ncbi:regulation of nuclear pre-mRNA domain-containing protein 1B [Teleopsis dalmanni]|uniref:regulation of nuclear pre-mRNA domain-containing protein 1B n=1 Tax=Teleopsis dalmanni TaxID=139649 RepID=UPI0018CD970C|nr:regulation of nuclear pre-mRNA domain-containing protein 1B [Teleopsis dalmanni]